MSTEQITLRELLTSDPIYKKWFSTKPTWHPHAQPLWRVYVQREDGGGWSKKDFDSWVEGHNFLAKHLREWYDSALICRNYPFTPPVIRVPKKKWNGKLGKYEKIFVRQYHAPVLVHADHLWCSYCRRPTVFGYFTRHHAFSGHMKPTPYELRCTICGIRRKAIKEYRPKENL